MRSFGATGRFFFVRDVEPGAPVVFPLSHADVEMLHPSSIRLFVLQPRTGAWSLVEASRYDSKVGAVIGEVDRGGIYTAFGISRVAQIAELQRQLTLSDRFPDCKQIQCPADRGGEAWMQPHLRNACDECFQKPPRREEDFPEQSLPDATRPPKGNFEWVPPLRCNACPIGGEIAYADRYVGELFKVAADGTNNVALEREGGAPSWSPDCRRIAFHRPVKGGGTTVYVARVEGGLAEPVLSEGNAVLPAFCRKPGTYRLAWTQRGVNRTDIMMIDEPYELPRNLTHSLPNGALPTPVRNTATTPEASFSPDCSKLVYSSDGDLFILDVTQTLATGTTVQTQFTKAPELERFPAWSPDGKWIAVARGGTGQQFLHDSLWLYDAATGAALRLTEPPITGALGWAGGDESPTWHAASNLIVFTRDYSDLMKVALPPGSPDAWTLPLTAADVGAELGSFQQLYPDFSNERVCVPR